MKIVKVVVVIGLLLFAVVNTLVISSVPKAEAKTGTVYMAGNLTPDYICHCPVTAGNCVCAITVTDSK